MKNVSQIHFQFDPTNKTKIHVGRSCTLNPSTFVIEMKQNIMIIKVNLGAHAGRLCGGGRVVHFALCRYEAEAEEQQEIRRQAAIMRQEEDQRRREAIDRAHRDNNDIQKENQNAQQDYNRAMAEYQKKCQERCNYSQCSGGQTKCGVCNGRGNNTNNNHVSTCSSCSGRGRNPCNNCEGTMLKYPKGCDQPREPRFKDPKEIPSFGPMPNYEDMI